MLSVKLPETIEKRLDLLAVKTHRPKSFYVREAIEEYLEEHEDAWLALERLSDRNAKYYTTEEMEKKLGL